MKKLLTAVFLLMATAAFASDPIFERGIRVRFADDHGVPTFITGSLGHLGAGPVDYAAKNFLDSRRDLLQMRGAEDFNVASTVRDEMGQTHVKFQQTLRGLPVIGGEYIVHADADGRVFAMNGRAVPERGLPRTPAIDGWTAIETAAAQAGIITATYSGSPRLLYVVNERGNAFLAWAATASYADDDGDEIDIIYADAITGDLVLRAPQIHRARNRATYNGNSTSTLPGTLVLSETSGTTSDARISTAHAHAATSYDYYSAVHARDSFNNAGAQIKTTVHHQVNYNNAFWNGTQLVYGDGDGTQFTPLGDSLDVGAHELTHAVTTYSANLTYSNESGALNEATSDIMAAAVEAWKDGAVGADTWKIGEDVYTPGTAGDALR